MQRPTSSLRPESSLFLQPSTDDDHAYINVDDNYADSDIDTADFSGSYGDSESHVANVRGDSDIYADSESSAEFL